MLIAYRATASGATRAAIAEYNGLTPDEFAQAMARLDRGEPLDDRLLAQYAVAGTPQECLAQCRAYAEAGVTELALAPVGEPGVEDITRLGRGL